jgi:hypothetical protein
MNWCLIAAEGGSHVLTLIILFESHQFLGPVVGICPPDGETITGYPKDVNAVLNDVPRIDA